MLKEIFVSPAEPARVVTVLVKVQPERLLLVPQQNFTAVEAPPGLTRPLIEADVPVTLVAAVVVANGAAAKVVKDLINP